MSALTRAIRSSVTEILVKKDFRPAGSFSFLRIRGLFVDGVTIQLGRGQSIAYLHQYINLLADPSKHGNFLSYRVGHRYTKSPSFNEPWMAEDATGAKRMACDLSKTISDCSLPFFARVSSLEMFVVEIVSDVNHAARMSSLDLAISMELLGKSNKAIQVCEEMISRVAQLDQASPNASVVAGLAKELRDAITSGKSGELISSWQMANSEHLRAI